MVENREFREIIKYDNKFTQMFQLGDLSPLQENMIYSIFGELRDIYDENEAAIFSYSSLAMLAGNTFYSSREQKIVPRTGKRFETTVEELEERMTKIVYRHPEKVVDGKVVSYTSIPLFKTFRVDHENKLIKIHLSDAEYTEYDEVTTEDGSKVKVAVKRTVKDLFNNPEWGKKAKYIQYGRDYHNLLKSKYSKRLFRHLADWRKTGFVKDTAHELEQEVLILDSPSLLRSKGTKLQQAMDEINTLLVDEHGLPVIQDLTVERIKKGKSITHYIFRFKPFDDDLRRIVATNDKVITFEKKKELDFKRKMAIVMEKFYTVFPKGSKADNYNNKNQLKRWLETMDHELVIEALERTGSDANRTFGWTRTLLNKWEVAGYTKLSDLRDSHPTNKDNRPSNVPDWSEPNYENGTDDKDRLRLVVVAVKSAIKIELSKTPDEDNKADIKHLADKLLQEKLWELKENGLESLSDSRFEETREQLLTEILDYFKV